MIIYVLLKGVEEMTRDKLLNLICDVHPCADFNLFFNKWLDEYDKHVIEQYKADTNLKDTIKDIHDNVAKEMYCKGIDDFAILMKETLNHDWATTKISEQIIYNRLFDECDRIAEQLKEQNK